ncbi:MAG TPA: zinc ribbon domain-containing protein [Candidatus Limnocylindria bacterium]|nr:zinc ribbon domain-containing protein [Candidatus Limnocylindria bacterium]
MNVFCPNCGSSNDTANKFCWKCGTSLASVPQPSEAGASAGDPPTESAQALAPVAPPPVAPPPVAPTPIAPTPTPVVAPTTPVAPPVVPHPTVPLPAPAGAGGPPTRLSSRIPMPILIGGLVAVLGVGAAIGIVLGKGGDDDDKDPGAVGTPRPSLDLRTPGPLVSLGPGPTIVPATQAPVTEVPVTQAPDNPTPVPTTAGGGGGGNTQTAENDTVSITVPAAWEIHKKEPTWMVIWPPGSATLTLDSGILSGDVTTSQYLQNEIKWYKDNKQDVEVCKPEKDFAIWNGPQGRSVYVCYKSKSQSGNTNDYVVFIVANVTKTSQGNVLYYVSSSALASEWNDTVQMLQPYFQTIKWKMLAGT